MENTFYITCIIHHFPIAIREIHLPEHDSYLEYWIKADTFTDAVNVIKHNELNNSIIYDENGKKFDYAFIDTDDYEVKLNDKVYHLSEAEKELIANLKQIYLEAIKNKSAEQ